MKVGARVLSVMAVGLFILSALAPAATGASGTYLTTSITQSGVVQSKIGGYDGVIVNYTSTLTSPLNAFVYLDLDNSVGQTVYWNVGYCAFAPAQPVQCFVNIPSSVPPGNYTALIFATTNSSIPISTSTSLRVSL